MRLRKTESDLPSMGAGATIIYEDAHVVVVDKPAGLIAAMPNDAAGNTLLFHVRQYLRARPHRGPRGKGPTAWVIHTLDRYASGLVVFARSHSAYLSLKGQLDARRIRRRYVALVEGELPTTPAGQWVAPSDLESPPDLPALPPPPPSQAVAGQRPPMRLGPGLVRPADQTPDEAEMPRRGPGGTPSCRVLAAGNGRSLVELRLDAPGRQHVRSDLKRAGHPIVDERPEAAPPAEPAETPEGEAAPAPAAPAIPADQPAAPHRRLDLHAFELTFIHPATGKPVSYASPPPEEFLEAVGTIWPPVNTRGAPSEPGEGERLEVSESPRPPASPPGGGYAVASRVPRLRHAEAATPWQAASPRPSSLPSSAPAGWDHVAGWYEGLLAEGGSDYHRDLILPGILRLLDPRPGQRVLDVACGEGLLCRQLAGLGVQCVGVDASERLIASAIRQAKPLAAAARPLFLTGDARRLLDLTDVAAAIGQPAAGAFDAATCVLALMNMDPIEPVLAGVAELLAPGGRLAAVILHPAFRAPGQTSWQWEGPRRPDHGKALPPGRDKGVRPPAPTRQYRRVDAYLSVASKPIVMNPGQVASGERAVTTVTWHRPIQAYVAAFAAAGLLVDALEEWPSHRQSEPGPRAAEEDRARREIPMFLAIRGKRM